ncbi:MAG: hypothetical protein QF752_07335 [Planctomycetota bacterium]|nr:hypothetical protein [Planctomycetota bacterium]
MNDAPSPGSDEIRLFLFTCPECSRQTRLSWNETQQERACAGCGRVISVQEVEMLLEAPTERVIRPLKRADDKREEKSAPDDSDDPVRG